MDFYSISILCGVVRSGPISVETAAARSIMKNIIWLVVVCLIGLGTVVAIKIGTKAPEGANVDKAKVGAATEQGTPIRAKKNSRG
jgi:hypothetical protein